MEISTSEPVEDLKDDLSETLEEAGDKAEDELEKPRPES